MYIYNYFIILLGACVSYKTRFDTIHDTEKSKINSRYRKIKNQFTIQKNQKSIHNMIHDLIDLTTMDWA